MITLSIINLICFIVFVVSHILFERGSGTDNLFYLIPMGFCTGMVALNTLIMSVWTVYKYLT